MRRALLPAIAAFAATACARDRDPEDPTGPDFPVVHQTEFVDIAPGFTQPICQGSLDDIDRHVESVAGLLEIDVEDRITLFWFNENAQGAWVDDGDVCEWCEASCFGCYSPEGRFIVTRSAAIHHELVHAVVGASAGRSVTFFEEGVAEGLDRLPTPHSHMTNQLPTEAIALGDRDSGHFSRWLIDRYGAGRFLDLFDPLLGPGSTPEETFDVVEEIYGFSLEELEAEYVAAAPAVYPNPGFCDGLPVADRVGDRWEISLGSDCDEPHVFGPTDDGGTYVVAIIDVPQHLVGVPLAPWIPSDADAHAWPCLDGPLVDGEPDLTASNPIDNWGTTTFAVAGLHRIEVPIVSSDDIYLRLCPHDGSFPGSWPVDKTVDPQNCLE